MSAATPKGGLPAPKLMLMGPSGTGKTHSCGTLVDDPLIDDAFYFAYEQGSESLIGYWADQGKPIPEKLHICTVAGHNASFEDMANAVKNANTLSYDALIKAADAKRSQYNQLETFLRNFNNVKDDTGKEWGAVNTWSSRRWLIIDGLTGLCDSAMKACIGGKFARDQKDWGMAQNMVEGVLRKLTTECQCGIVLISHVERETDPNGGGLKLMASALGRALAPKLPAMFSDVVLTKRLGKEFYWDTEDPAADLKTRNLQILGKLPPSFAPVIQRWKGRAGL